MDPISNMLTRIRNAQAVKKTTVRVPFSNIIYQISNILKSEGFIEDFKKKGKMPRKYIELVLKYHDSLPAISVLKRISRPSQRIYIKKDQIKPVRQGFGFSIISTPKGLITNKEAKKNGVGGEIIAEIW